MFNDMKQARAAKKPPKEGLTAKRLAFCREYVKDSNATQAAIRAGYSEHTASELGSQLLGIVEVKSEIERLQAEIAANSRVTVESLLREAEEARQLAMQQGQPSAAVSATVLKSKLTGNLTERREEIGGAADFFARQQALVDMGGRLAELAASLGLPESALAQPEAIAAAAAERGVVISNEEFESWRQAADAKLDRGVL